MAEKEDEIIEKKMLKPDSFNVYYELYAAREEIIRSLFSSGCVRFWCYACDVAHNLLLFPERIGKFNGIIFKSLKNFGKSFSHEYKL